MSTKLGDDYKFYYEALEAKQAGRSPHPHPPGGVPFFPSHLQPGRYLMRGLVPVLIWRDPVSQGMRLRIGNADAPTYGDDNAIYRSFLIDSWSTCEAITREEFDQRIRTWVPSWVPPKNHNQPPAENSRADLKARLDALASEADRLIKAGSAGTQTIADTAADLANMLLQISQRADEERKKEQSEWREQINVSNAEWYPVRDDAANLSVLLKKTVIDPFLNQVEAAAKAERERQEQQGIPVHPEETRPRIAAGTRGRQVSRRTVTEVAIIDYYAALEHFRDHPDMVALVKKLAERAAKTGVAAPGTEIVKGKVSV